MATPRVFVSSTYYDLKYIRENLKYFVKTLGYEPILSEEGDVFYNPRKHTHDSCLSEVISCQIFVLIIGGRFGGNYKESDKSITNSEYEEAIRSKIPVFALIESSVYSEYHVYNENVKTSGIKVAEKISYPSIDNVKIFEFINVVRKSTLNNAIIPFKDFTDIEIYLKKQWAGMMYNFLTESIEETRVSDTLTALTGISERVEILTRQILNSVGSAKALLTIKLYEIMVTYDVFRDMTFMHIKPTPQDILKSKDFISLGKKYNKVFREYDPSDDDNNNWSLSGDGEMSTYRLETNIKQYKEMREKFISTIKEEGSTVQDYLAD